jgi:hypothetical protein
MEADFNTLTRYQWEEIINKRANQITAKEYERLAFIFMTTNDPKILEDIINRFYVPSKSYNMCFISDLPSTEWKEDGKMQETYKIMQTMINGLINSSCYASPEKLKELQDSGILEKSMQRAELLKALLINNEVIATSGYSKTIPQIELNWEDGDLAFKYHTTKSVWTEVESIVVVFAPSHNISEEDQAMIKALNPDWKMEILKNPPCWYPIYDNKERVIRVHTPQQAASGSIKNKQDYENYICNRFGLSSDDISKSLGIGTANYVADKIFELIPPIGAGKGYVDILAEPINKALEVKDYKTIEKIGNIGDVVNVFNLTYISTDVNGNANNFSFSLYPGIVNPDYPKFTPTLECIENFNNNLFLNPQFTRYNGLLEKPLTLDDVLDDPQKVDKILKNLVEVMEGVSIKILTDTPYPPKI